MIFSRTVVNSPVQSSVWGGERPSCRAALRLRHQPERWQSLSVSHRHGGPAAPSPGSEQRLPGESHSGTRPGIVRAQSGKSRASSGGGGLDGSAGSGGGGRPTAGSGPRPCKQQRISKAFPPRDDALRLLWRGRDWRREAGGQVTAELREERKSRDAGERVASRDEAVRSMGLELSIRRPESGNQGSEPAARGCGELGPSHRARPRRAGDRPGALGSPLPCPGHHQTRDLGTAAHTQSGEVS